MRLSCSWDQFKTPHTEDPVLPFCIRHLLSKPLNDSWFLMCFWLYPFVRLKSCALMNLLTQHAVSQVSDISNNKTIRSASLLEMMTPVWIIRGSLCLWTFLVWLMFTFAVFSFHLASDVVVVAKSSLISGCCSSWSPGHQRTLTQIVFDVVGNLFSSKLGDSRQRAW